MEGKISNQISKIQNPQPREVLRNTLVHLGRNSRSLENLMKVVDPCWPRWHMPIILATWKVEVEGMKSKADLAEARDPI
jgi:hypothetical protein